MPIDDIERSLFRVNLDPYASDLSRHGQCKGECVGIDPTSHSDIKVKVARTLWAPPHGSMKVFSLVDTNIFTEISFLATRPPIVMMLCGSEGGSLKGITLFLQLEIPYLVS